MLEKFMVSFGEFNAAKDNAILAFKSTNKVD
jgi:hypothetical protein